MSTTQQQNLQDRLHANSIHRITRKRVAFNYLQHWFVKREKTANEVIELNVTIEMLLRSIDLSTENSENATYEYTRLLLAGVG